VWQENFRKNKARRLAAEFGEHFAKGMMAVRFQQCLYRAIIDTSLVNRAARKIWKRVPAYAQALRRNRSSLGGL